MSLTNALYSNSNLRSRGAFAPARISEVDVREVVPVTKVKIVPQSAARIRGKLFMMTSGSLSQAQESKRLVEQLDEVWRVTPESVKVRVFCDPDRDRCLPHSVKLFLAHK